MAHYPKAPITEAVIDIKVKVREELTLEQLLHVHSGEEERYPKKQIRWALHAEVTAGAQLATASMQQPIGHQFVSGDGKQVAQVRLDGFTFSKLSPYDRWESFRDEAKRLWTLYRNNARPSAIIRLAVRYINRIDIPLPVNDFKEFLRTVPEVSSDMAQGLARYFMQLQVPLEDVQALLILNEAMIEPAHPGCVSVVLDLDISRDQSVPSEENEIWDFFEKLRSKKNDIFEACITDKTRRLFV